MRLFDEGSSTMTGWKRRSSAASRSMYLRNSSRVVAPMHCSSPRASDGLRMFAASTAPSAAPAPTSVCSSSMNRMHVCAWRSSSMIFLRRSSNSPRYFVPATSEPMSSVSRRLPWSVSGTSPFDDAVREAFGDRGLADAGLADERRVVLGAAREDLDDPLDLLLAADDRVELAARAIAVRSMPSWSRVGVFELADLPPAAVVSAPGGAAVRGSR